MRQAAGVGGERGEVLQGARPVHLLHGGDERDAGEGDDGHEGQRDDEAELVDDAPPGPLPAPFVGATAWWRRQITTSEGGGVARRPALGALPRVATLPLGGHGQRTLALGHEKSPQASEIDNLRRKRSEPAQAPTAPNPIALASTLCTITARPIRVNTDGPYPATIASFALIRSPVLSQPVRTQTAGPKGFSTDGFRCRQPSCAMNFTLP
ncbi:hypothetical protein GCM10022255_015250 [Dactylosporangium darangshiense]|uniref:Uncharacterized protein n=1 Tax=Dactylosporangium darangshiense TaxID=579108 RepID=A0ABP8D1B1_9ACTN